ncbi:hypothetical protein X728_06095 [Mesorhizobium sp. L103C120A0]|nr:hypothetical protein X728_06095 [Mesorhizobium sp. L103C120A0]
MSGAFSAIMMDGALVLPPMSADSSLAPGGYFRPDSQEKAGSQSL